MAKRELAYSDGHIFKSLDKIMTAVLAPDVNQGPIVNTQIDELLPYLRRTAPLPEDQLQLLDRIVLLDFDGGAAGKGMIITEMDLDPDLWFFDCHFPGDPILPGCLGIESLWQSLGLFLALRFGQQGNARPAGYKGRALGVESLKLFEEVRPQDRRIQFHLEISKIVDRNWTIALASGVAKVDDRDIFQAEQIKVGMFPNGS